MKKTILAILAAFCGFCASVRADDEGEGGEGDGGDKPYLQWAMPQKGWGNINADIRLEFAGWEEPLDLPIPMDMTLDEIGKLIEMEISATQMSESAKNAFKLSKQALANAAFASIQAQRNTVRIDNLCASVEALFSNTYGQYETAGGKVISKIHSSSAVESIREQLLKSKNNIAAGGSALGGTADKPIKIVIDQKPYSEKQFEQWEEDDNNSLVSLKGYQYLDEAAGDEQLGNADIFTWAVGSGNYYIPYTTGKTRSIQWMKFRGADSSCLSGGLDTGSADDKQLHIRYWSNPNQSGCSESIQNLLTNKTDGIATDRQKHALLARYDTGGGKADVHWVKFDASALEAGGSPAVDDHTIEQSIDPGAAENSQKKLRLYGFKGANAHMIPMKEAAGDNDYKLAWTSEITADGSSLVTNPVDRTMSLKGWHEAAQERKLSDIMLTETPKQGDTPPADPREELNVLVRRVYGQSTNLQFFAFGDFYKMSWSTNWNDAVKGIVNTAEDEHLTERLAAAMTNLAYTTKIGSDTIYDRLTNLTAKVDDATGHAHETYTHLTNLAVSAEGELDAVYDRLTNLTARAEGTQDQATTTYAHLTNIAYTAQGDADAIYDRLTNLVAKAENTQEEAATTYTHLTNLAYTAQGDSDEVYDRITNILQKARNAEEVADNAYTHLTNLVATAGNPEAVYHHITNITQQVNYERITNIIYETRYEFITNVTEYMHEFENWTYVTNYLVMYMGVDTKPPSAGGQVKPPEVAPEDDPYDGKYKHDEVKDEILPVKTALIVNDATNKPLEKLNAGHMFDFDVLDTNIVNFAGIGAVPLVQLRGFRAADVSTSPKIPIKRKQADFTPPAGEAPYDDPISSGAGLDWTDYPLELFGATTNELQKVLKFLRDNNITNILHTVVSNNEWLAAISTNFYTRVNTGKFLDKYSVWTNWTDQARTEIFDFHKALPGDYLVKGWNDEENANTVRWEPKPKPDASVIRELSTLAEYNRSLEKLDDYGYMHETNVWQVYGFQAAEEGQVPKKHYDEYGNAELRWESAGSATKFIGTDTSAVVVGGAASETNEVRFASASDSNVKVHVASDGQGGAVITLGVYYLQDSGSGSGGGSL